MGLTGAAAVPAEGDPADLAEQLRRERETVAQLRAQVDRMVHERTSALDERTRILLDVDREEEFLVNRLQKQITAVALEKRTLESHWSSVATDLLTRLRDYIDRATSSPEAGDARLEFETVSSMVAEVYEEQDRLRVQQATYLARIAQLEAQLRASPSPRPSRASVSPSPPVLHM